MSHGAGKRLLTTTSHDSTPTVDLRESGRERSQAGGRAWLRVGVAVAAVGWGANQFAPLLLLYRSGFGLSASAASATFGLYAAGLVPGLLIGGPLSDRIGRRPVLLAALVVSLAGTVLLIAGGTTPALLYAGRLVAGVASGAAFSSGTAWIKELSTPGTGPRRATIAMTTGFAAGPIAAGLLAQWAPHPATTAYLPHLAITFLALLALLALAPDRGRDCEPPPRREALGRGGRSQSEVGADGRSALRGWGFWAVVVPLAPWVFGAASVGLASLPGLVLGRLGDEALVFAALVTGSTALAGIAVQPLARRMTRPGHALAVVVAGLLLAALAAALTTPVLIVVAAVVLGAGYGCCQVSGLREVQRLARTDELARVTAAYQAISYTGFALPFLLTAARPLAPPPVLLLITAVLAVCSAIATKQKT